MTFPEPPKFEMPEFNIEEVLPEMEMLPIDKDIRLQTLKHAVERGGSNARVLTTAARFEDYIHNGLDGAHDEGTMQKVYNILDNVGSINKTPEDIISEFQNAGILFRERITE